MATDRDDARKRATEGDGEAEMRHRLFPLAEAVATHVAEMPSRSSPDDWPEAMLVTQRELEDIILFEIDRLLASPAPEAGEQPAAPSPEEPYDPKKHGHLLDPQADARQLAREVSDELSRLAAPSPEPAPPMKNGEGSLCGLCDGTYQHEHQRVRCPKCGAEGLAENWPFRKCEGCAEPRCKARVWDNGDMTDCGLAMPCSTHGKPEPEPLCEEAREWLEKVMRCDQCPKCGNGLDTGGECTNCGYDYMMVNKEAAAAWSAEKRRAEGGRANYAGAIEDYEDMCKRKHEVERERDAAVRQVLTDLRSRIQASKLWRTVDTHPNECRTYNAACDNHSWMIDAIIAKWGAS